MPEDPGETPTRPGTPAVRAAQEIGEGIPVDLQDVVTGLDKVNTSPA
jgi:hypothetical protein